VEWFSTGDHRNHRELQKTNLTALHCRALTHL